jgi:hypothetical protein
MENKSPLVLQETDRFDLPVRNAICAIHNTIFYCTDDYGTTHTLNLDNYGTKQVYKKKYKNNMMTSITYAVKTNSEILFFEHSSSIVGRDVTTLKKIGNFSCIKSRIDDFACSKNLLFLAGATGIGIYDLRLVQYPYSIKMEHSHCVAVSNDETTLVTASSSCTRLCKDNVMVQVWDIRNMTQPTHTYPVPTRVNALLIHDDNVFVALHDGSIIKNALRHHLSTILCNSLHIIDSNKGDIIYANNTCQSLKKWGNNIACSDIMRQISCYDMHSSKMTASVRLPWQHVTNDTYYHNRSEYQVHMDVASNDRIIVGSHNGISIYQ